MTASTGTAANISTGLREFGDVTNTYAGYLTSAGAAYNLQTPWQADKLEVYNYTEYGTNAKPLQHIWFRDFPAGDGLSITRGTTDLTSALNTTNGVTVANSSGGFTDQHLVSNSITTATPAVVTTTAVHGLSDDDRVMITKVVGTMDNEVNNKQFVVDVLTTTTFGLYDTFGVAITTVGSYTSGGQVTKVGPELGITDTPILYYLTLGTDFIGADSDVLYFVATKFNRYVALGDIA